MAQPHVNGWPPPAQLTYGGWGAPPPRRSKALGKVLVAVVGMVGALFFVLIVLGALVQTPVAASGDRVSHVPAPASSPNATPVNPAAAVAVLQRNTLYDQGGLPNRLCRAHDLGAASTAEQTDFYQALMSCLNDEWRGRIRSAGFRYADPGLVVFDSPVTTPCGNASPVSGRTLAFYCPSDAVMYADVPQMRRFFADIDVAYAVVIGHEFGHHVQSETGMLTAYDDTLHRGVADRAELSRRLELQASCMGGLFLGAVADSFPIDDRRLTQLRQVAGSFGDETNAASDERDHGSGESNQSWILTGFDVNDIARCNTFAAKATAVD